MSQIPEATVLALVDIGRQHENESALQPLFDRVAPFADLNSLHWEHWDAVTQAMSTSDVFALLRGLTLAEKRFGGVGSVSGSVWVFRELQRRAGAAPMDAAVADAAAEWTLANSDNPWVPFSNNFGSRSLAEYRHRRAEHDRRIDETAASQREAAGLRAGVTQKRRHVSGLRRTPTRVTFLESLSALPVSDQLLQLSRDQEFPVEWYPTRLARTATLEVLCKLDQTVREALCSKMSGRHRGPWGVFKRRLRESLGDAPIPGAQRNRKP